MSIILQVLLLSLGGKSIDNSLDEFGKVHPFGPLRSCDGLQPRELHHVMDQVLKPLGVRNDALEEAGSRPGIADRALVERLG